MDNDGEPQSVDLRPLTKIVASYLGHHTLAPDQLSPLIVSVQQALHQLERPVQPEAIRMPAVSVRRSVQRNHVVCLECGFRGKTLRRHISMRHGLQVSEYLRRWHLANDHPLTAPAYSEQRSAMAKEFGLGRRRSRVRSRMRRPRG